MKNRINQYWRMLGSGISFSVFAVGSLILSLFFTVVRFAPISTVAKHRWILSSIKYICRLFVMMMRSFGLFRYRFNGQPHLPAGGHLVIANHPSLIDALFIVANTDNLCCVVKTALFQNPITSYIVKTAGYIPNSSETLLEDAQAAIVAGKNLLIFPEGTRNTPHQQLEFKRGAANVALAAQCPITPVVIEISPSMLQKGDRWYDMPAQQSTVVINVYQSLDPAELVDDNRPVTIQARQLNRRLIDYYQARLGRQFDHKELAPVRRGLEQPTL